MATTHPDNHIAGRLNGRADVRSYLLGGRATFTLVSKATGRRFTYKVESAKKDREQNWSTNNQNRDLFFVSVLMGSDNDSAYQYLGMLKRRPTSDPQFRYEHGGKSRIAVITPSAKAFIWFIKQLEQRCVMPETLEFWHEGSCGRCGRKLTVPSSIENGMGPECASKVGM